ncbi:MAG: DUF3458 domain-containing protein [Bacteroidia bacterium]|nr:DUF3458 domain-containing protein [Bacteroidia bacterium]
MKALYFPLLILALFAACKTKKPVQTSNTDIRDPHILLDTVTILPDKPAPVYRASVTRYTDLLHTRLDVSFDWSKKYLNGKALLTCSPYWYPSDSLILNAKGFDIKSVSLGGSEVKSLLYNYDGKYLRIKLDRVYTRLDKYSVYIEYTAKPDELPKGGSGAITSDKGLYFINADGSDPNKPRQIWTQGETEAGSCWFPTIDRPNERQSQEIYITVEKKYVTLSNGLLISSKENSDGTRTDHWKQELPHAPYLTMMAIGEYAVVKDLWKRSNGKEMEVNYYVEKEYEPHAKAIFGNTPEMISFFSKVLGVEYPWDKYSQIPVRDYVSGAMENTSATIFGEFIQRTTRELLDRDGEDIIAHELSHHWFGDLVTCESWSNLPLNESFATYCEYLWEEHKRGRDAADLHHFESYSGYISESTRKKEELIRFDYEDKEDMFDGHSYNKGGQVLHMLRKYVGDDAFFASLKLYLERNKFKSVEIHDLRLAFEEITGEDLNWFFSQWFLSAGHPDLTITHLYDESAKKYTVTIRQTQDVKKVPVFRIPMYVDIYSGGKMERKSIVLDKQKQDFVFDMSTRPDWVNVDPEKAVLCTRKENFSVAEYAFMYRNGKVWWERNLAMEELNKRPGDPLSQEVIIAALNDPFWSIRQDAIRFCKELLGSKKDLLREKITHLAKNDPKASVRAEAVEFLAKNYGDASVLEVFKTAMKDPSYAVIGQGLRGITKVDPKDGMNLAKGLEGEKNTGLLISIASLYAEYGDDSQNDFFLKVAPEFKSFSNIGFLNTYVQFLKRCSDETVLKGIPVFEKVAKTESSKWVRYFGQKGVNDLAKYYKEKAENLQGKLKSIKETNPNAPGIAKMEADYESARLMAEKLTVIYNSLIQ